MSSSKVAVVTGGNKGIGFAIVKGLCEKFNGTVYLTARNVGRGEAAVQKLKDQGLNPVFHQLDILDKSSIGKLKEHLVKKHGGLDLLINNAGIAFHYNATEPFGEQAKTTIEVNYFGLLNACEALFPILRNNAKVVNLSSSLGLLSRIPSDDLKTKLKDPILTISQLSDLMKKFVQDAQNKRNQEAGWGTSAYAVSKVGVAALTRIQQRNFDAETPNRNICVNAVHPGYVDTDMTNHNGTLTTEQGARAPLFLALEAQNFKGEFVWSDSKVVKWDGPLPR